MSKSVITREQYGKTDFYMYSGGNSTYDMYHYRQVDEDRFRSMLYSFY